MPLGAHLRASGCILGLPCILRVLRSRDEFKPAPSIPGEKGLFEDERQNHLEAARWKLVLQVYTPVSTGGIMLISTYSIFSIICV